MTLTTTDADHVLIFDTASGNPLLGAATFSSVEHAEDFLRWCETTSVKIGLANARTVGLAVDVWAAERLDSDGFLRDEDQPERNT